MKEIIATLGAETGATPTAIKKWRQRGKVPHEHRLPMLDLAAERALPLSRDDFEFEPFRLAKRKPSKRRRAQA